MCTCSQTYCVHACMLSCLSCVRLCDPMGCSPPGSSVPGILQARMLEWVPCPLHTIAGPKINSRCRHSQDPLRRPFSASDMPSSALWSIKAPGSWRGPVGFPWDRSLPGQKPSALTPSLFPSYVSVGKFPCLCFRSVFWDMGQRPLPLSFPVKL